MAEKEKTVQLKGISESELLRQAGLTAPVTPPPKPTTDPKGK